MCEFSFVIPCYRSELSIRKVVEEIDRVMATRNVTDYEIVMVNDYSPDGTWPVLKQLAFEDSRRICVNLAKNVGQHGALMAGFRHCNGQYVVTSDDDLQTPLDGVWAMKDKLDEGYDVVTARYTSREGFSLGRRLGTLFNRATNRWLAESKEAGEIRISAFLLMRKFVVDELARYTGPFPYVSGLVKRVTLNIASVELPQRGRAYGQSGYSLTKLMKLWANAATAFSLKPLRVADVLGMVFAIVGFLLAVIIIIRKLIHPEIAAGWSSTMSVVIFIGGIMMIMLGVIGEYIGRIYLSINGSPQYVVRETLNDKHGELPSEDEDK
ncbi:MAG: glycosyltransferase family 2 protein [Atopobiaceae bacterium]|nr:glycosyltransferase family 2 protein [Atopobiaceae bacterium]